MDRKIEKWGKNLERGGQRVEQENWDKQVELESWELRAEHEN